MFFDFRLGEFSYRVGRMLNLETVEKEHEFFSKLVDLWHCHMGFHGREVNIRSVHQLWKDTYRHMSMPIEVPEPCWFRVRSGCFERHSGSFLLFIPQRYEEKQPEVHLCKVWERFSVYASRLTATHAEMAIGYWVNLSGLDRRIDTFRPLGLADIGSGRGGLPFVG